MLVRPSVGVLYILLATAFVTSAAAEQRPNILLIYADDVGYGDLSCYGGKHVETPNLDKLAREGVRFTDGHSPASTCTPSRRALLTAGYSWRQKPASSIMPGDAPLGIDPGTTTIASLLREQGYSTGLVGKWHLGLGGPEGPNWNGEIKPGPVELGFDYAFFIPATGDRVPCVYIENHKVVGLDPADPIQVSYGKKIGDEPTGAENPELLKLKHTHGHDNTIVNGIGRIGFMTGGKTARWKDEDMMDVVTTRAITFLEKQGEKPFFLFYSTHNAHVPRVPHPRFAGKSKVGNRGDVLLELDDAVGRVLATLERIGKATNTLVIFTSDNGGVMNDGYEDVGRFEYNPNGSLRGKKSTVFEGGHRVPFIVRWPGVVPAGKESGALITQVDFLPTFAAAAGVDSPAGSRTRDGFNLLNVIKEAPASGGRPHFVAHNGGVNGPFGVREGDWKLVQMNTPAGRRGDRRTTETALGARAEKDDVALFNLAEDLGEQNDVAEKHPEKVRELNQLLEAERQRPQ